MIDKTKTKKGEKWANKIKEQKSRLTERLEWSRLAKLGRLTFLVSFAHERVTQRTRRRQRQMHRGRHRIQRVVAGRGAWSIGRAAYAHE